MGKPMDAEEIGEAVRVLEESARVRCVQDILAELREGGWVKGTDDEDTWEAGFTAACEIIAENFPTE